VPGTDRDLKHLTHVGCLISVSVAEAFATVLPRLRAPSIATIRLSGSIAVIEAASSTASGHSRAWRSRSPAPAAGARRPTRSIDDGDRHRGSGGRRVEAQAGEGLRPRTPRCTQRLRWSRPARDSAIQKTHPKAPSNRLVTRRGLRVTALLPRSDAAEKRADPRRIAPSVRCRTARDIAIVVSNDSSIFPSIANTSRPRPARDIRTPMPMPPTREHAKLVAALARRRVHSGRSTLNDPYPSVSRRARHRPQEDANRLRHGERTGP